MNFRIYDAQKALRLARSIPACGWSNFRLARKAILQKEALQKTWELTSALSLVSKLNPKVVMEIGTAWGGTLFAWAAVATADASMVTIDLPYKQADGQYSDKHAEIIRSNLRPTQHLDCLWEDSHLVATFEKVAKLLAGKPVDFLFIDGDHSYAGVKADFEMYSPLVRPGGLIGFHDVAEPGPNPPASQREHAVWRFWKDLEGQYKHWTFIDEDKNNDVRMGIGILEKP